MAICATDVEIPKCNTPKPSGLCREVHDLEFLLNS